MYIANATGCSSIWGNSLTSTPYTKNIFGRGTAWNNSLFEDNAEFGYVMLLGQNAIRESLVKKVALLMGKATCNLKVACNEYLNTKENSKNNLIATDKLLSELKNNKSELAKEILDKKDLASIAMSYGYVYVAQIALGYDMNQAVKALTEAENYPGPSLIIAYAPCINHGIK